MPRETIASVTKAYREEIREQRKKYRAQLAEVNIELVDVQVSRNERRQRVYDLQNERDKLLREAKDAQQMMEISVRITGETRDKLDTAKKFLSDHITAHWPCGDVERAVESYEDPEARSLMLLSIALEDV